MRFRDRGGCLFEDLGGLGIIILLGSFILGIVGSIALAEAFPDRLPQPLSALGVPFGWLVGGALCWTLGRYWNRDSRDPGGRWVDYMADAEHRILGLPMEYWGMVSILLGILTGGMFLVKWIIDLFS